jgi:hypothetical protein
MPTTRPSRLLAMRFIEGCLNASWLFYGTEVGHTRSMQRRHYLRLLVLLCVVTVVFVVALLGRLRWTHERYEAGAPQRHLPLITPFPAGPRPDTLALNALRTNNVPQSFSHRLRCTQYHQAFGHQLSPEVLSLLCDRKALDALKVLSSMAEAGDERALTGLALLGNVGGSCDALKPSPTFSNYADKTMKRARDNGATSQTLQRLSEVLTEEQAGPTLDELEACRQSALELKLLSPTVLKQFVSSLGRSFETLLGENEADVQIEYDRKMLMPGDADGQLRLADELLQKGTADSQAEALALLRQAASTSPSASTELAKCLLKGCPTPAPDSMEARQLLTDAALGGDLGALIMLSGATDPQFFDPASVLPASEQYAWSQFLQRLDEQGCFGTSRYLGWVNFPTPSPSLMAMSPADSTAAEARAAELIATHLDQTREQLGCN